MNRDNSDQVCAQQSILTDIIIYWKWLIKAKILPRPGIEPQSPSSQSDALAIRHSLSRTYMPSIWQNFRWIFTHLTLVKYDTGQPCCCKCQKHFQDMTFLHSQAKPLQTQKQ